MQRATCAVFRRRSIFRAIFPTVEAEMLHIPSRPDPSYTFVLDDTLSNATVVRSWIVDPWGMQRPFPAWATFMCAIPAFGYTLLSFLEKNLASVFVNRHAHQLSKPATYHVDLLILGVCVYPIMAILGLPYPHASIPRARTYISAVTVSKEVRLDSGKKQTVFVRVIEQRISSLLSHLLILIALQLSALFNLIPKSVLYGVFLHMGISGLQGNQMFERLGLFSYWEPKNLPDRFNFMKDVGMKKAHLFTAFQVTCLVLLFLTTLTTPGHIAIAFPLFAWLTVIVRKLMSKSKLWTVPELRQLDGQ
jgi:hypothetical protein